MAQVTHDPQLRARIDRALAYLIGEWESLPLLAGEWAEWDEHGRFVFAIDWPIREDRLYQLQQWAEQDLLLPAQRVQYEELLRLVAQHRPLLEELIGDEH